jgi:hypothetical protein
MQTSFIKDTLWPVAKPVLIFIALMTFVILIGSWMDSLLMPSAICWQDKDLFYEANGVVYQKSIPVKCSKLKGLQEISHKVCSIETHVGEILVKTSTNCP